jgi:hypothetical protein
LIASSPVYAALTPEQEALKLSKILKPISDEQWRSITGGKTEKYSIVRGDTLFDISRRLFGDGKYWPKIWALNNGAITNPHKIRPGNQVAFEPGSGTSLPGVSIAENQHGPDGETRNDANEPDWKRLPPQRWENFQVRLPAEIDPLGFDKRNKIRFNTSIRYDLNTFVTTEEVPVLGKISGARTESNFLILNDVVYVESDGKVQVGDTYTLTAEPNRVSTKTSNGRGYSYSVLGKVKIIGVRDNLFFGTLQNATGLLPRGSHLIALQPPLPEPPLMAGLSAITGSATFDLTLLNSEAVQHHILFVDRGSDDGVQPGMVFRNYNHEDPSNKKKITNSDILTNADMLVLSTTAKFSTCVMIRSVLPIAPDSPVVLLTDISDLQKSREVREKSYSESGKDKSLEELDQLDFGGGLGKDEERELKQLERWKGNPSKSSPETPHQEALPPPPPASNIHEEPLPMPPAQTESAPPPTAPTETPAQAENAQPAPPPSENDALPLPPPLSAQDSQQLDNMIQK